MFGPGGGTDAFVAAFSADGNSLIYADQFGGAGEESGNGIVVDGLSNAYVTGHTTSMAINSFPVTAGAAQIAGGGADDAFVAKFNAAGAQVYATYLGGTGQDHGNAIAIDSLGNAYVTGECQDAFFPTATFAATFKPTITGSNDAFIVKLDPTGSTFLYETYVGGSDIDEGTGIAVDSGGNIYITGYTFSADFPGASFPTVGQTTIGTAPDAFVFKLHPGNPGGGTNDGVYATYLGASGDDRATGIVVDNAFNAYVTGITFSGDFPLVGPIAQGGVLVGAPEAFVTELGPTGATKVFSTYLGGTTMSGAQGIALDSSKNIYAAGWTNSSAATFPLQTPFQAANNGSFDAFVSKFGSAVPPPAACTINPIVPSSGFTTGGTTVTVTGTGFVGISVSTDVAFGGVNASSFTVVSATQLTTLTPSHAAGLVALTVTTSSGTCTESYTYVAPGATACLISGINPSSGTTLGGGSVTILGANFFGVSAATDVAFGGTNAASYAVNLSSDRITAVTPAHAAGSFPLVVTTSSGICQIAYGFVAPVVPAAPVCTIVSLPTSGSVFGGNTITLSGANFTGLSSPGGVRFDGVNAASFSVNAASTVITAVAPRHPLVGPLISGTVPFTVTGTAGTCSSTYVYNAALAGTVPCGPDFFYPSPATGATGTFAYCMDMAGTARVRVYNAIGDIVAKLEDYKQGGPQISTLNTARLAPGVYLYVVDKNYGGGFNVQTKMKKFVVKH